MQAVTYNEEAMRILVTGFEPFGDIVENPSALIVEELARCHQELHVAILPTEFSAAELAIGDLLRSGPFDVYLALGVAAATPVVRLERTARNLDDANRPDNTGEERTATLIVPGGPEFLTSALPLAEMLDALEERGVDAVISDDAGGYVCNHVFYSARHVIESEAMPTRCGFIHVPLNAEQIAATDPPVRGMPLATLVEAVECCLDVISGARTPSPRQVPT
jgi:pyroglutamyl-peptidase